MRGEPLIEIGFGVGCTICEIFFDAFELLLDGGHAWAVFPAWDKNVRRMLTIVAIEGGHRGIAKEGAELVKLLHAYGVKFMIVTGRALCGDAEPYGGGGGYAVVGVDCIVFFGDRTAFTGSGEAAMKSGGDNLIKRGIGHEIAAELLDGELIPRHVLLKRIDDPIAIRPDRAVVIDVNAVSIGVACCVEPLTAKVLCALN